MFVLSYISAVLIHATEVRGDIILCHMIIDLSVVLCARSDGWTMPAQR